MELPTVFPIFPLDEVILVPGQMLPLHIFEKRYRDMVADALEGERAIAMAIAENGDTLNLGEDPPVHPVCGLGRIVHYEEYDDGCSDIILEGLARMQIQEELDCGKLYRIVRARPFEEIAPEEDVTDRACRLLHRIEGFDDEERSLIAGMPLSPLLDSLLLRIPAPMWVKRRIFAERALTRRLEALERAMDRLDEPPRYACFDPQDPRLN